MRGDTARAAKFKLKYTDGNFNAYANFSYNITRANRPESNQISPRRRGLQLSSDPLALTDDMQRMTGSAGASLPLERHLFTTSLTYGSGLRAGDLEDGVVPNSLHTTPYARGELGGISHDFTWSPGRQSRSTGAFRHRQSVRIKLYELRTGSGIGEFAPSIRRTPWPFTPASHKSCNPATPASTGFQGGKGFPAMRRRLCQRAANLLREANWQLLRRRCAHHRLFRAGFSSIGAHGREHVAEGSRR